MNKKRTGCLNCQTFHTETIVIGTNLNAWYEVNPDDHYMAVHVEGKNELSELTGSAIYTINYCPVCGRKLWKN